MRSHCWLAVWCAAAVLGQAVPSSARGVKDLLRRGPGRNQEQVRSCVQRRALMAYFQDDKGSMSPVRDTLNTDHDKDWMGLRFTDYDGPRIRLGVLKVINKSAESEERGYTDRIEVPLPGIQEMLTVALYNTKRFDVIEQKRIEEVKTQQTRQDVAEPSPTSIVNIGKVLGAQYLVYGTVNEWNPERSQKSMSPRNLLHLNLNGGKKDAEVAITFTLTDVANGQILYTTAQRARMGEWSIGLSALGNGEKTENQTPVNYAVNACANKAAFEIAKFLRNRKWKGTVIDKKKADIYINAGSQQGMTLQTKLSVQSVRGIVKDQESRTILGEDLRGIGTLEVVTVQTGFSIARIVEGCKGMKIGDRVELATDPVPQQIPPECAALDTTLGP